MAPVRAASYVAADQLPVRRGRRLVVLLRQVNPEQRGKSCDVGTILVLRRVPKVRTQLCCTVDAPDLSACD